MRISGVQHFFKPNQPNGEDRKVLRIRVNWEKILHKTCSRSISVFILKQFENIYTNYRTIIYLYIYTHMYMCMYMCSSIYAYAYLCVSLDQCNHIGSDLGDIWILDPKIYGFPSEQCSKKEVFHSFTQPPTGKIWQDYRLREGWIPNLCQGKAV